MILRRVISKLSVAIVFISLLGACSSSTISTEVNSSPNDRRAYRAITLDNGLRVILVQDTETKHSAATMAVHVGSNQDPKDRPGLAHFLEHMLFLGTEKYPKVGEYREVVEANGGYINAFTSAQNTVYLLQVKSEAFEEILDRFAQFFIAPSFAPEYVDRERHAVNSEYEISLNNDGFRTLHALKAVSNPNHPFSQFMAGNLETLSDRPDSLVREDLMAFYESHYSADQQTLAIVAPDDLDTQEAWVRTMFSAVPQRDVDPSVIGVPTLTEAELGRTLYIVPQQDLRRMTLSIPSPISYDRYSRSEFFVAYLLGTEAEGGLAHTLQQAGLTNQLTAYVDSTDADHALITVEVQLTEAGVDRMDDITDTVFDYIRFLEAQDNLEPHFEVLKASGERRFTFVNQIDASAWATHLAMTLEHYDARDVIYKSDWHATLDYNREQVYTVLKGLVPERTLRVVMLQGVETNQVEPYYNVDYRVEAFNLSPASRFSSDEIEATHRFSLPPANPFIPKQFAFSLKGEPQELPVNLYPTEEAAVWYQGINAFPEPRRVTVLGLWSKVWNQTPQDAAASILFVDMFSNSAKGNFELYYLADASPIVGFAASGLQIGLSSFSDQHDRMLENLVDLLENYEPTPDEFAEHKAVFKRRLENMRHMSPIRAGMMQVGNLLDTTTWDPDVLLAALDDITLSDAKNALNQMTETAEFEFLYMGDVTKEHALTNAQAWIEHWNPDNTPREKAPRPHSPLLPGDGAISVAPIRSDNDNAGVVLYYQMTDDDAETLLKSALLSQALSADFFHELRTEEQLAYALALTMRPVTTRPGVALLLESSTISADDIESRMRRFLAEKATYFQEMSPSEWETLKASIESHLLAPAVNLAQWQERRWAEIYLGRYRFDTRAHLLKRLETLTQEEMDAFFKGVLTGELSRELVLTTDPSGPVLPINWQHQASQLLPELSA